MKKLIVVMLVSLMFIPAFAQPADGDIILGGSFRIQTDGDKFKNEDGDVFKDYKDFQFNIGPKLHFMLTEHISVGGQVFFDMTTNSTFEYPQGDPDEDVKITDKSTGFGLGPVARYWWQIGEKKKFGLFAEAGLGFSTYKSVDEEYDAFNQEAMVDSEGRTNRVYLYAVPGMYYAPAKCFFFEVTFNGFGFWYFNDTYKAEGSDDKFKSGYFDVGGDLNELFFGDTQIGFNLIF